MRIFLHRGRSRFVAFKSVVQRGFTLAELLIVSAMIALLSGIGIFAINEMYNSNIRKITIAECFQIATALSIAEQQLQFYPRFNYLPRSKNLITLGQTAQVVPRLDYFGFLTSTPPIISRIQENWTGPYMPFSAARDRSNRGSKSGVVKVRLPDVTDHFQGVDFSFQDWPADIWGQPYMLLQLKSVVASNGNIIPSFIERESENADFLNAVVSYGKNGYPGGNEFTEEKSPAFVAGTLEKGSLFVKGDPLYIAGDPNGPALFTIRTASAIDPNLRIENNPNTASSFHRNFLTAFSVKTVLFSQYSVPDGRVGMNDDGTDDIIFKF